MDNTLGTKKMSTDKNDTFSNKIQTNNTKTSQGKEKISPNNKKINTDSKIKKNKQKDLTKVHGVVNHTGVKIMASFVLLLIAGAAGYATYKFIDLQYKGIPEYIGLAFMWIGVLAFAYFVISEIILKEDFFTLMSELYHYEPGIYYLFLILLLFFFITFGVILWSNVTATPPLNLDYKRHCPIGTKHSDPEKHPSQIT